MLPLSHFVSNASATELVVVASPSSGFGPIGVLVFFALLAAGFYVFAKRNPEAADNIARGLADAVARFLALFKRK